MTIHLDGVDGILTESVGVFLEVNGVSIPYMECLGCRFVGCCGGLWAVQLGALHLLLTVPKSMPS